MSISYHLNDADKQVLAAVRKFLRELAVSTNIHPAELVSVAKTLHVISRLPRVTDGVCVTIEVAYRTSFEYGSSSSVWQFSVGSDWLALSCGGSEYTDSVGSDSFTTMIWSARPGERAEYDGSWDDLWMERDGDPDSNPAPFQDLGRCEISIDDDDNPLLSESEDVSSGGDEAGPEKSA